MTDTRSVKGIGETVIEPAEKRRGEMRGPEGLQRREGKREEKMRGKMKGKMREEEKKSGMMRGEVM